MGDCILDHELLYNAIRARRSARRYVLEPLTPQIVYMVQAALKSVEPIDASIRTELRFYLDGAVKGYTPYGIAAFTEDSRQGWINAGYALEQMDLWFAANGLGSCWLGRKRRPGSTPEGLTYAASVCFGLPLSRPRTRISQFRRKKLDEITDIDNPGLVLETVRLAPSAANRQPWYFTGTNENILLSTKKRRKTHRLTDIDVGIALLYIDLTAEHMGDTAVFTLSGSDEDVPLNRMFQAQALIQKGGIGGELRF